MKIEIESTDLMAIAKEVTGEVIKALKPLLKEKGEDITFFTVKSLAGHLQVSEKWVYERVQFNEIPFTKIGSRVRFKKSDIDAWLDTLKTPVVNPLSGSLTVVKQRQVTR